MDDLPIDRSRWRRRHHPWRTFGERFREWQLEWTGDLPDGVWGRTLHAERRVLIADHLDQAERRCTIAHETQHILRGPIVGDGRRTYLREEHLIDRTVGRLLVPRVQHIGHALAWHGADHDQAAWELWVDDQTLSARLSTLTPAERAWLDEQLGGILVER